MGESSKSSSKKHRSHHHDDKDDDKKRHKSSHRSSKKHHRDAASDDDDDDQWVEKVQSAPAIAPPSPTRGAPVDSFGTFSVGDRKTMSDGAGLTAPQPSLTDGFGEGEDGSSAVGGRGAGAFGGISSGDLFSDMGTERKRREIKEKPDPTVSSRWWCRKEAGRADVGVMLGGMQQTMGQSSRELNKAHWQGTPNDPSTVPPPAAGSPAPGSSGSAWRMMKVKRTFETADEEDRPVEEVAMERYGSLEAWHEALEERRILDEREGRRRGGGGGYGGNQGGGYGGNQRGGPGGGGSGGRAFETPTPSSQDSSSRRFVFTDSGGSASSSRPASRGSFRRPGEALERTASGSSSVGAPAPVTSRPGTPVPSVFTPPASRTPRTTSNLSQSFALVPDPTTTASKPPLTQSELNKLQAKVLKARLMGNDNAAELEKEYEKERERTLEMGNTAEIVVGGETETVKMLPTLDGRGRLYDVGTGQAPEEEQTGKRKKKEKVRRFLVVLGSSLTYLLLLGHRPSSRTTSRPASSFATTPTTIRSLSRSSYDKRGSQRALKTRRIWTTKWRPGASSFGRGWDLSLLTLRSVRRIAGDAKFQNNLDYVDENAEKLARKKMRSDVLKKAFAVQGPSERLPLQRRSLTLEFFRLRSNKEGPRQVRERTNPSLSFLLT